MLYSIIAKCIVVFYKMCSLLPKKNQITFFSRQGKQGSLDFRILVDAVKEAIPDAEVKVCATDPESKDKKAFILSTPPMVFQVARSRVCVLEGYIPAVSVPSLDKQTRVIQLWHAMGAIKKFGYQSIGTSAGRSEAAATNLRMHMNYDWIVAAGPGAIGAYADAFDYDIDAIKPLGMPRMDYLLDGSPDSVRMKNAEEARQRYEILSADVPRLLYVPTLRKGPGTEGWMDREVANLAKAFEGSDVQLLVAGHPLDGGCDASKAEGYGNVHFLPGVKNIDLLEFADYVVTDYSAMAFEAGLLKKSVWFYVPDIEQYRVSPGLNIDPIQEFPNKAFVDAEALASAILGGAAAEDACEKDEFDAFMDEYFAGIGPGSTERLTVFVRECYIDAFDGCCQEMREI